jgi:hypothetical protein
LGRRSGGVKSAAVENPVGIDVVARMGKWLRFVPRAIEGYDRVVIQNDEMGQARDGIGRELALISPGFARCVPARFGMTAQPDMD